LLDPLPNRSLGHLAEMRVLMADANPVERAARARLNEEHGKFGDPALGADARNEARRPAASPLGIGDRLVGERTGRFYFLAPSDVDYITADGNYIYLQIGNDRYINRDSLKRLAPLLEPLGFIRISRSALLNLRRVAYAEREGRGILAFTLNSGVRLVSSAGYRTGAGADLRVRRKNPRLSLPETSRETAGKAIAFKHTPAWVGSLLPASGESFE